jgi:hypothetical protein
MRGEGGWLGTIAFIAVLGAIAAVGLWYWGGGRDGSRWAGSKEAVIARLVEDCLDTLQRQRAIRQHNTEAQIRGACNCVSEEFYVQASDLEKEKAESSESYSLRGSMEPAIKKCIQRTGLGISE